MPRIYVQFAGMKQLGDSWNGIGTQLEDIRDGFQKTVKNLDWDIKCQAEINNSAVRLSSNLENYKQALQGYQNFFQQAYDSYVKLDEGEKGGNETPDKSGEDNFMGVIGLGTILAGSNYGKDIYDIVSDVQDTKTWKDFLSPGKKVADFIWKFIKDAKNYKKIGNAVGTSKSLSWFVKNALGLKSVGYVSQAKNVATRFVNNLRNVTSPFHKQLMESIDNFTGANGVKKALPSWITLAITGASNWSANKQEQAESGGTMSDNRVAAETVVETVVDTLANVGGQAIIGAAISAAFGSVAAPVVVVTALSGLAVAGINVAAECVTGKTATELISDGILNAGEAIAEGVGNAAVAVANSVGSWWNKVFA